jgi:hypothetical protein
MGGVTVHMIIQELHVFTVYVCMYVCMYVLRKEHIEYGSVCFYVFLVRTESMNICK